MMVSNLTNIIGKLPLFILIITFREFVVLIRKVLSIILFVFLSTLSLELQVNILFNDSKLLKAFLTFWMILIFLYMHYRYWPYRDARLNKIELLSLITLIMMLVSGIADVIGLILPLSIIFNSR